jgi:hypothetical protein
VYSTAPSKKGTFDGPDRRNGEAKTHAERLGNPSHFRVERKISERMTAFLINHSHLKNSLIHS